MVNIRLLKALNGDSMILSYEEETMSKYILTQNTFLMALIRLLGKAVQRFLVENVREFRLQEQSAGWQL